MSRRYTNIEELINKIIIRIGINETEDEIHFYTDDGKHYEMYHEQDCCECVYIDDIAGNIDDLLNSPIIMADESSSDTDGRNRDHYIQDFESWTFYKFATVKGYVTIRWYGTSNGCYSEDANFVELEEE